MKTISVRYFAALREHAGCSHERLDSDADNATQFYGELLERHAFTLEPEQLRVVINGEFADWNSTLREDDEVVFLPPVAGG